MEDEYFAGKIKGSVQWIGGVSFFLGFGAEGAAWVGDGERYCWASEAATCASTGHVPPEGIVVFAEELRQRALITLACSERYV